MGHVANTVSTFLILFHPRNHANMTRVQSISQLPFRDSDLRLFFQMKLSWEVSDH